jgi:hypothetical protein
MTVETDELLNSCNKIKDTITGALEQWPNHGRCILGTAGILIMLFSKSKVGTLIGAAATLSALTSNKVDISCCTKNCDCPHEE